MALLAADEPHPVRVENADGPSPFLFTADHAGRRIPRALGDLGLPAHEFDRHIAWDIGIEAVTRRIASALDAASVYQLYSRLVIDCNRRPDVPSAFPEISEATRISGNQGLSAAEKARRRAAIFDPYHAAIEALIEARIARGQPTLYVAMHSFTPVYHGIGREMDVAVLYHRNPRLSHALAECLRAEGDLNVAENEPYKVGDETDYGVPVHAERRGLDYLEIEIRQDLITEPDHQAEWAARLARLLPIAAGRIGLG